MQLAEYLGIHRTTVINWREKEGLLFIRIKERSVMYSKDSIDKWLKSREVNQFVEDQSNRF